LLPSQFVPLVAKRLVDTHTNAESLSARNMSDTIARPEEFARTLPSHTTLARADVPPENIVAEP
jgi:hypothetical protein